MAPIFFRLGGVAIDAILVASVSAFRSPRGDTSLDTRYRKEILSHGSLARSAVSARPAAMTQHRHGQAALHLPAQILVPEALSVTRLGIRQKFANFLEEIPIVPASHVPAAPDPLGGARQSPLFMAEQFRGNQRWRQCGTVHTDESTSRPLGSFVNGAGNEFFAVPVSPEIRSVESLGAILEIREARSAMRRKFQRFLQTSRFDRPLHGGQRFPVAVFPQLVCGLQYR